MANCITQIQKKINHVDQISKRTDNLKTSTTICSTRKVFIARITESSNNMAQSPERLI